MRTLGTRHRNPTIVLKTSAPTAFSESIHKGREFRRGSKPASSAFWAIAEMVLFLGIAAIVLAASGDWHLRRRHVRRRSQNVSGGERLGHFGGPSIAPLLGSVDGSLTNPGSDLAGGRRPCQKSPELTCQNFWNPLPNALRFKNSDGR
jgi:hypothetical protein